MISLKKKLLSLLLAVTIVLGTVVPCFAAADDSGVIGVYDIQIFQDTLLVTDKITLEEGTSVQLNWQMVDETTMPDNSYVKWWSSTPTLASVDQKGLVRGHDSSKGAVCRLWLDNEVKTIPLVGKIIAWPIEQLFNKIEVDQLDTDSIVNAVSALFTSEGILGQYASTYADKLCESLRKYLNEINSNIHVTLYDKDGNVLADDFVEVVVTRSTAPYADLIPNGTHITNKDSLPTTVAVGSTVQLSAVTTPVRLRMGVVYTVKETNIFNSGKAIATVDGSGLVTFKNTGTVTIMVSPDTDGFINNLLKYINMIYASQGAIDGVVDNKQVADILIKVLGLDINRTVLIGILDVLSFVVNDAGDPVKWAATAVKVLANFILQFTTNDTITFTVVDEIPVESFEVTGTTAVSEGSDTHLAITNVQPAGANAGSITWSIEDPAVAAIEQDGTVHGRDAGGGLLTTAATTATATISNGMKRSVTITVRGRTGNLVSDVAVNGEKFAALGETNQYTAVIYPARAIDSAKLQWGVVVTQEDGTEEYVYATEDTPAENAFGRIDVNGVYTPLAGGETYIVAKAYTGTYFTTSSAIKKFKVSNGVSVTGVSVDQGQFVTVDVGAGAYLGNSAALSATVSPQDASNKNISWSSSNGDIKVENGKVSIKAAVEKPSYAMITVKTEDGGYTASTYVSFVRNKATGVSLNKNTMDIIVGKTDKLSSSVSHTGSSGTIDNVLWTSSDEGIAKVDANGNVTGVESGVCTITCTSVDGGFKADCTVTVRADKAYLNEVVNLVENTVIELDKESKSLYREFARALDYCYYIQDEDMALQSPCNQYANELLMAFYRLNSFIQLTGVEITVPGGAPAPDFISKKCSTSSSYKNNKISLAYTLSPGNAMYKSVKWASSSSSVSVKNGICQPTDNKPCYALITVTATDYMDNVFTDSVYVAFANYPVTGVTLDKTSISGASVGHTQQLKTNVSIDGPVGIVNSCVKDVIWSSSDEQIASVDANGLVTFHYGGNCVITATTVDGGYQAHCTVNVVTNFEHLINLITTLENLHMQEVDYLPSSWTSFWATVDEGKQMVAAGTATQKEVDAMIERINVERSEMVKYNHIQKIKIYTGDEPAPEHLTYDCSIFGEGFDYRNAKVDLGVRLYPTDGNYKIVDWSSDNETVGVTADGVVSPKVNKPCYATITCTVLDDFGAVFVDSIYVVFAFYPVTGVTLDKETYSGAIGDTVKLTPTLTPTGLWPLHLTGASIKEVFWTSDNETVAGVDASGNVTLKSAGAANITCTTLDGGFTASCLVAAEGDKTALKGAMDNYANVDLMNYEYQSGLNFTAAMEHAKAVYDSIYSTQSDIDSACEALMIAYNSLVDYVFLNSLNILCNGQPVGDYLPVKVTTTYYHNTDITLSYNIDPVDAMVESVKWSASNNKNNIEVKDNGATIDLSPEYNLVSGKGGYVDVTITATDFYGRTMKKTVTVCFAKKQVSGITIDREEIITTKFDDPVTIHATVTPNDANLKDIRWTSSDPSIAKVENGVVTALNTGSCTITASTMDGGYTKTCAVTVTTDRRILTSAIVQAEQENLQLVDFTPESFAVYKSALEYAYKIAADWSYDQATVDGAANKLNDARAALVAYVPVSEMTITRDGNPVGASTTYAVGAGVWTTKSIQLGVTINPENAMYERIEWTSSNSKITVDSTGLCKPTIATSGYHSTVITCTVTDHHGRKYTASTTVLFVDTAVTGVELDQSTLNMNVASTALLKATVLPVKKTGIAGVVTQKPASCQEVIWSTSDPNVAAVVGGTVVATGTGTAEITVTTIDGRYTATCRVTVS